MPKINVETGKVLLGPACYGTTLPSTCTPGDTFVKTDATNGQQMYACTSTDTWVLQGGGGGGGSWGAISGTLSDQTDLQTALDGKSATGHNHAGVYEPANANIQSHISSTSNPHSVTKAQVGLANADNTSDASKPVSTATQTALDGKAAATHTHAQSDVTNLVTDLSGKAAASHTHAIGDTTGLQTALDGKAASSHTHVKADVTDFAHTHAQADVTNLTTDLAGKAAASHTHAASDIASGTVATARLGSGTADGGTFLRGDQTWATPGGGGLPAGVIVLILSGTCPSGFTEVAGLDGFFVRGTVAGNADIGTTDGQDTVTEVLNHTHPVTDPGHVHGELAPTSASGGALRFAVDTNANGSVAAGLDTASATTGITTSNPAGGVASIDNRPVFKRVIFCSKD